MMEITAIKETIKNDTKAIFDRYDVWNAEHGMNVVTERVWDAKESLRELFRKHPNWNEENQSIRVEYDSERKIDEEAIKDFWNYIYHTRNNDNEYAVFLSLVNHHSEDLGKEKAEELMNLFPDMKPKARENSKTAKVVRKILTDNGYSGTEWEREYAKFADAIKPKIYKKAMYISLNILDYVLSSNGVNWSSCHTLDKNNPNGYSGMHMAGALSYALDSSTIVTYELPYEFNEDKPYLEKKVMRNLFHYENGVLVQGRVYPQCNDGINGVYVPFRAQMQKVISTCLGMENKWLKKGGTSICCKYISSEKGSHYHDWEYRYECNVSRIVGLIPDGDDTRVVYVGEYPICPVCGREHTNHNTYNCEFHRNGAHVYCRDCGRELSPEDSIHELDGNYYCDDCSTICTRCGSTVRMRYRYTSHSGRNYCPSCGRDMVMYNGELYPRSSLRRCPRCGDLHLGPDNLCEVCQRQN